MRKREVAELAAEMVLVLSRTPEEKFQREKAMILSSHEEKRCKGLLETDIFGSRAAQTVVAGM